MTTLTISLPEALHEFIEMQVKQRGFGDTSEYLRGLVRDDQESQAAKRLENLILESLGSSPDIEATPQFWSELKAEALDIAEAHRKEA